MQNITISSLKIYTTNTETNFVVISMLTRSLTQKERENPFIFAIETFFLIINVNLIVCKKEKVEKAIKEKNY
jgi:hypothetical protein